MLIGKSGYCQAKSGPGKKWTPGPLFAAKSGPGPSAKSGPIRVRARRMRVPSVGETL